jgi:hypothetical protein
VAVDDDRKKTGMYRPWLFGVPIWAWFTGWAIGLAIALPMFDSFIVAALFALSIGTAFAMAFAPSTRRNKSQEHGEK